MDRPLRSYSLSVAWPHAARQLWEQRLRRVKDMQRLLFGELGELEVQDSTAVRTRRTRRCLIDTGGNLLNAVFSITTEQEVAECKRLLQKAAHSQDSVSHVIDQLVSVLKPN